MDYHAENTIVRLDKIERWARSRRERATTVESGLWAANIEMAAYNRSWKITRRDLTRYSDHP